MIDPMLLHI